MSVYSELCITQVSILAVKRNNVDCDYTKRPTSDNH